MNRRAQLHELYGIEFPDELLTFWTWYSALTPEEQQVMAGPGGMRVVGLCDVLAGKFDGVELRYPAALHWRFRYDPPEFFTVLSGDTDGLHWGYWFDDPAKPPVVAGNYARESHEFFEAAPTLLETVIRRFVSCIEGAEENCEHDPGHVAEYRRDMAAMDALCRKVPRPTTKGPTRVATRMTNDGMGVVIPAGHCIDTDPQALDVADLGKPAVAAMGQQWIADGKAGLALFHAKEIWEQHRLLAMHLLEPAYRALGRPALAEIVKAHRAHPMLPSVDILGYRRGDYASVVEALAAPEEVVKLALFNQGVATVPDLSTLVQLERLQLNMNHLTEVPRSLAGCRKLKTLFLSRNQLTVVPAVVGELPSLAELTLDENRITIVGDELRGCTAERIELGANPITSISAVIGELPNLRFLDLSDTLLDRLPDSLGLAPLHGLGLNRTPLVALPPDLSGWRGLKRIMILKTQLPPSELERLRAAAPDATIVV